MALKKRSKEKGPQDTRGDLSSLPEQPAVAPGAAAPQEEAPSPVTSLAFPVVGVGASAGGLAAFEAFFSGMPIDADTGMAFVLVQHLSPDHGSMLTELVRRYTSMQVHEAEDGMEVRPDNAYIIPPNADLALEGTRLRLSEPSAPRGQRLPIDFFFRSLAREQHERAICVVLSGTGSDGTLGVRTVKGEGGMAMAQAPETTEHDGMPRSAIATGLVDYVLPPAGMAAQIISYTTHAFGRARQPTPALTDDDALKGLTALLRSHTGHDFSQYKPTTLLRRMQRRMALHQIADMSDYLQYAGKSPPEVEALFRDLLIGVTNFFRDPDAFKILEERVIPQLVRGKASHEAIRVWVCGCSTGEEAYSIAILLQEQMQLLKRNHPVQIFATDIDRHAIEHARQGVFPASIAADITPERLSRFFSHEEEAGVYRAHKVIRDMLVFSEQDVITDPPFSRLDLISCRNLLIYLTHEMQRKLIPLFHYALRPGGHLFLGTSETIGEFSRLFAPVDRKWKLYQALPSGRETRPAMREFVARASPPDEGGRIVPESPVPDGQNLSRLTETALLDHYVEAGVLERPRRHSPHPGANREVPRAGQW